MDSVHDDPELPGSGCPIRKSPDQSLLSGSPKLNAASHVLLRLLAPRHPPYALSSLTIFANATQQNCSLLPVFSCQRTSAEAELSLHSATNQRLVNGGHSNHSSPTSLLPYSYC